MSNPKISVIIPVYNIEDYLEESLISILNQSMIDDLEVIMVDDGSTDDSRYIIEKYALDYDNFHAYHKENEGQGIARNFALNIANGDYIHFFDADDYLPPKAYETLYGFALKNDTDIIVGNVLRFARYNVWEEILFKRAFKDVTEDIDSITFAEMPSLVWDSFTTNKIYKREFLKKNGIKFLDEKIYYEDLLFSLEAYILAGSVSISKDVFYYWRLRSNNTSVTQRGKELTNFRDRLKILKLINDTLDEYDVPEELRNSEYMKWLHHDLRMFTNKFDHFPQQYHEELFSELYDIVSLIPDELINGLNTYKRVTYTMIRNRDLDNFVLFAPLEGELFANPHIPPSIDSRYHEYFDFMKAKDFEELYVYIDEVTFDEAKIFLNVREKINYLRDDDEYDILAALEHESKEYPLDIDGRQIIVPVDLVKDKNHMKIRMTLRFSDFEKETYLKVTHRHSLSFENIYVDLNGGVNSFLVMDIRKKADNEIVIEDISFANSELTFKGKSKNKIENVTIENIIDFEKIYYPVEHADDDLNFEFKVPYGDVLKSPVKKWEVNCEDSPNSIRVSGNFEFFTKTAKISIGNTRNKVLIENDILNVYELNDQLNKFRAENRVLKGDISKLNSNISELESDISKLESDLAKFKSRKIIKFVDGSKNLFKRRDSNDKS